MQMAVDRITLRHHLGGLGALGGARAQLRQSNQTGRD
jgi:hypothetical protein